MINMCPKDKECSPHLHKPDKQQGKAAQPHISSVGGWERKSTGNKHLWASSFINSGVPWLVVRMNASVEVLLIGMTLDWSETNLVNLPCCHRNDTNMKRRPVLVLSFLYYIELMLTILDYELLGKKYFILCFHFLYIYVYNLSAPIPVDYLLSLPTTLPVPCSTINYCYISYNSHKCTDSKP